MEQGLWGVEIRSLDSGELLYERNSRKLMMPASNMKIVTLAAAAETLGWDYRFATTLETSAPIADGILHGDLVVRGNGDPTINRRGGRSAAVLDEWAASLRAAGVTRIDGRIIGDDSAFDDAWLGRGWSWDYLQYGYAAPVGALQFDEDNAALSIRPGAKEGDPVSVELTAGSGLTLINRAFTGPSKSANTIDYWRHPEAPVLEVTGSIAVDAAPASREAAVVNPTAYFARAVKAGLAARGVAVSGDAIDMDDLAEPPDPSTRRTLVTTSSPPLSEIATVLMKVSQNLYAETLLKAVGASKSGLGTTEGGRLAARELMTSWGIPERGYVQADGSGLSRYDLVTADMLVTILTRMIRDERHRDVFVSTLPIGGEDGSLSQRMKATRAQGNARAKTGSIANVRTLSGYVRTRDGELLVFSMLANSFAVPPPTVNWMEDLAVETLANFTRK